MAAQVELQTTEVGRTGVGGRIHLSPLTDSSNKSPMEGPSNSQGPLIIPIEHNKPAPGPKPRLTPKPFAVEKNPTIRPILAPKPQTKPRPESTRPTSYNPDPPSVSKPQQQNVTSQPRPVSTNPGRPASTSFKPSSKLTSGQTTKPVIQPFKPAPSLTFGDPGKPSYPSEGLNKLVPTGLSSSKSLKKSTAAEWFGSTQQKETPCPQTARTSMTRAKSMGFLNQIGKEEEDEDKGQVAAVSLRPHSRGSRPRPVSAIFLPSPSHSESQSSFSRWEGRRPLSADLTSKFESIGLSLHRKPAMADCKENTPEEGAPPRRKERESEGTVPGQDSKAKPVVSESEIKRDAKEDANKEERSGGSIKRRISLLFDSSLSCPVEGVSVQGSEPPSPVKSLPEAAALLGVKQRIKKLTADTPTAPSPSVKTIPKPRPLPLDLKKRFTSERSTDLSSPSFNEVTERHEVDRDSQRVVREWEGSGASPSDQAPMDEDGSCTSQPFSQSSPNLSAGRTETGDVVERVTEQCNPGVGEQKVRAALFENVVERHSVQVLEDGQTKGKATPRRSFSIRRRDVENEGSLVTATYHQPVSPSSPLRVEHSFDTVPTVSESRVQSVSVPVAQLEDKAMTLRSRQSESRPGREGSPAPVQGDHSLTTPELQPRFLRIGALHKWSTAGLEKEAETEREKQKDLETEGKMAQEMDLRVDERERQREAERKMQLDLDRDKKGEEVAAPKRLKMLEGDDRPPKPRATYFALTGQIQDTVSTVDEVADRGDMEIPVDELSIRSGRWASQGKAFSSRRNPSLDEALSKSLENQEPAKVQLRSSHVSGKELVRDRNIAIEEMEIEKQRELEKERQREHRREIEKEKQRLLEIERQKRLEFARMKELEEQRALARERQKEFEKEQQRELERERKLEVERRRQQELERERIKELEMKKQQALEMERIKELENARQQEMERQRQQELERERHRQFENQRLQDLEKERQRQLEVERKRLLEREKQRELDKERQQLETQRERQMLEELERIKDMERRQLLEFEKKKQIEQEKLQQLALEKQKLREQLERKEAEKMRQMAIQQEVDRQRQIEREREKQREQEQERLKALERERQMELAKQRQRAMERQKQLDSERQELESQKLRQQQEKERQRMEELERMKEMERRQLLEFEKQKQVEWERQQQLLEKQSLRDKMEREEAERMRQTARQQELERHRIKEKQRKEEQENTLDLSPLRPKVLDLDSVSRDDQFARGTPHFSDPASRWKQPSLRSEDPYKPPILDIDSFRSQTQKPVSKEASPMAAIQNVDFPYPERHDGPRMIAEGAVRQQSPLWAPSQQMLWEPWLVEAAGNRPIAAPEPPRKPVKMPSIEQLLLRQEGRVLAPERTWSGPPSESPQHTALVRRETIASTPSRSRNAPGEQTWFPREPEPQGQSRVQARGHRRSHGGQDLNRTRSRSVSRRSAPAESVLEGSLARMRSRSAHRDRDLQGWEQQTQNVSLEEQVKESDTLVHDTDSQYGTWETGLRTDDSLTPATPTSDSKPTPPPTPGDHTSSSDLDTPDGFPPPLSSESQALSFPETSTTLLDSSALRSRVQLGKQRAPRSRPTRAARQTAALSSLPEGPADTTKDWRYRDSTEAKLETEQEDSDPEEQVKGGPDPRSSASSQPQRVPIFPGMDPSALKAQLKKRGDSDNQADGLAPSTTQLSRSPKSPFLPRAARVLPPAGGNENGEEDSPKWLRELKSKKRLSQYENDI